MLCNIQHKSKHRTKIKPKLIQNIYKTKTQSFGPHWRIWSRSWYKWPVSFLSRSHSLGILSWSVCWEILSKSKCLLTLCQHHVFMDFHCWQSPQCCWPRTSRITLCKHTRVHSHNRSLKHANARVCQSPQPHHYCCYRDYTNTHSTHAQSIWSARFN